jgi:DNA helicase-2/ATP-dependent DNA helicase PcrA
MTDLQTILDHIQSQKDELDDIIKTSAARYYMKNSGNPNFVFDIDECNRESYNLSMGKDLCYDRPGIGFSYALWYHGRRVNTFIRFFAEVLYKNRQNSEVITLFDLGAGTGAVQCAIALCLMAFSRSGIAVPKFKVINVDTSPFMLDFCRTYLWPEFVSKFPASGELDSEYHLNSWSNPTNYSVSNSWISASYLFDHTENKDEIRKDFSDLIRTFNASKLLLLTSTQSQKMQYLNEITTELKSQGFSVDSTLTSLTFHGEMTKTHQARQDIQELIGIKFPNKPTWDDRSLSGTVLTKSAIELDLEVSTTSSLQIYNPPSIARTAVKLSRDQSEAAKNDGRPTVIVGPAGCGKSIVITERIKNLIVSQNYNSNLRILVTTFNKQLLASLGSWLESLLDMTRYKIQRIGECSNFIFEGSQVANVQLMHFDVLPTRVGNVQDNLQFDSYHKKLIQEIVDGLPVEIRNLSQSDYHLRPTFLLEEYHRVKYGLMVASYDEYENVSRRGRKQPLQENQRKVVRMILEEYEKRLLASNTSSIIFRRLKFLRDLADEESRGVFTHVFVDEFQDCTQADYAIFYRMLSDSNNIVIAGDYAQAVHIGKSADSPRDTSKSSKMGNFNWHRLAGSYRLPFRISECIKPISASIKLNQNEEADIITPYKGAPPGARPIIVYGQSIKVLAEKIMAVVQAYSLYDICDFTSRVKQRVTILERDKELRMAMNQLVPDCAETDSILRLKGMEKRCVIWSTRVATEHEDEVANYVYTILTRTSGILIIAILDDSVPKDFVPVLKELRKDRLILWDKETKSYFEEMFK